MDFRDRQTRDAAADIAQLLATAYQRYRRARRIELSTSDGRETVNGEPGNARPERLDSKETACAHRQFLSRKLAGRLQFSLLAIELLLRRLGRSCV